MEQVSVFKRVIEKIQSDDLEAGLAIISEHLLKDCILLMGSINKVKDKYELYSLFYDNYLDLVTKVKDEQFAFVSDSAFKSFFKTGCSYKAKTHMRLFKKSNEWLSENFFEKNSEEIEYTFFEIQRHEYALIQEHYGIDLDFSESDSDLPAMVIKAFHKLNEKCKFLLVLKYMLSLSHKEIVDCLSNFYELKNENVSKVELKRCLDHLKKGAVKAFG